MKKIYFSIYQVFFIVPLAFSQPTITSSSNAPVVGDSYSTKIFTPDPNQEGSSGASQVWSWPAITEDMIINGNLVLPSATPYAATFPSATVCNYDQDNGNYEFLQSTAPGLFRNGVVYGSGIVVMNYSNPQQVLKFPYTYLNTYSDTYAASFAGPGYNGQRTGSMTSTADAWGTLTTPAGMFTNVLRIHIHEEMTDTFDVAPDNHIIQDTYQFFTPGIRWPLMIVVYTDQDGSVSYTASWTESLTGIYDASADLLKLEVYPNPASDEATLTYALQQSSSVFVGIADVTGRMVQSYSITESQPGTHTVPVDVINLNEGIYFASVTIEDRIFSSKLVVRHF
jgi:hypothetical protein